MKSLQLMAAPAVKLQIGKNNEVSIDTASTNGKKTFKLSITTDEDSISNTLDEVVEEVKNEIENNTHETKVVQKIIEKDNDFDNNLYEKSTMSYLVPIVLFLAIAGTKIYDSRQKRLIKEAMIKNGMTPPEEKNILDRFFNNGKVETFEQKKYLKYTIIAFAFGFSVIVNAFLEKFLDIDIFFGLLAFSLGFGFLYIYRKMTSEKVDNTPINDDTIDSNLK